MHAIKTHFIPNRIEFSSHRRHVHIGGFPTLLELACIDKITDFLSKFVEISYGIWDLFHSGTVTSFH
jgi:hypothetical protein